MKLSLIALCLLPAFTLALAAEKKKVDLKPNSTKEAKNAKDPGSATNLLFESPQQLQSEVGSAKKPGVAVTATCKDHLGMIHKQGDKSYEGCLRTLDKTAPAKPTTDKNAPSMGITIGQ